MMQTRLFVFFLFSIFFAANFSYAAVDVNSATRIPQVDWRDYSNKSGVHVFGSVQSTKTTFDKLDIDSIPDVSQEELKEYFVSFRDTKFFKLNEEAPILERRASWLYPDDGCWIRAQAVNVYALESEFIVPKKIFIFGNLNVKTDFSPNQSVSWWYHVVPILRVGEQAYVIDPAIDFRAPMKLEDWILSMVEDVNEPKLSICNSFSYGPNDSCERTRVAKMENVQKDMILYLNFEFDRVSELGFDPLKVLGDSPIWYR